MYTHEINEQYIAETKTQHQIIYIVGYYINSQEFFETKNYERL